MLGITVDIGSSHNREDLIHPSIALSGIAKENRKTVTFQEGDLPGAI